MSLYIKEQVEFDALTTDTRVFGGPVSASSIVAPTIVTPQLSGSELRLTPGYSASLGNPPTIAGLNTIFPNATTGSLYLVQSGSSATVAFKDAIGLWRYFTSSFAV